MHALEHVITVAATPSAVFTALTTKAGLRAWHTADAENDGAPGGIWHLGASGSAPFAWEVIEAEPDTAVGWRCQSGPGTSPGSEVHYAITPQPDGRTDVYLVHSGWSTRDGNFTKCNTLWGGLLAHLKRYLESGDASPMFV